MLPIHLAGLALAGRSLQLKHEGRPPLKSGKTRFILKPRTKKHVYKNPPGVNNPVQTLMNGLSNTYAQIKKVLVGEDYDSVIRNFLQDNIKPLTPRYPQRSKAFQLIDLDGDSADELVTSYRYNDEIKTLILKKQGAHWYKFAETSTPGYEVLSYRNSANITGEEKKQLLIAFSAKDKPSVLHGYSLEDGGTRRLFTQNFNRFEIIDAPAANNRPQKAQIAVWEEKDEGSFNINVLNWNGTQLEKAADTAGYYRKSVIPYYVRKVKQSPASASGWYNLAKALADTGARTDAMAAVEAGMSLNRAPEFNEKFTALKNSLSQK